MAAGALVALTVPASAPFVLNVGGRNVTGKAPLGPEFPWRISEVSDGSPSQMEFYIEDADSTFAIRLGDEVRFVDRRSSPDDTIFGGHLVNVEVTRRDAGYGRMLRCLAVGYDAYLDWRIVGANGRWSSKDTKPNGSVTKISSDRTIVQQLVNKFAGFLRAPNQTVIQTNTNMDVITLDGLTLRDSLSRVAETATGTAPESTRHFYVDRDKAVHYYWNSETTPAGDPIAAPYRISDGSYTQTVLTTSGLIELWTFGDTGPQVIGARNQRHAWMTGTYQRGLVGGIVNEPLTTATRFDGSTAYATTPSSAAMHPGDTFTFECWYKRERTGALEHLIGGDVADLSVRFDASDHIVLRKSTTSDVWTTTGTFEDTSSWHHLAVTKSGSSRAIYVDGVEKNASGTNATIVGATGSPYIIGASTTFGLAFRGQMQHVALYNVALSAATVRAHYRQGAALVAQSLRYELDAMDGREAVYVAGHNDAGSGWVRPGKGNSIPIRTAFGTDEKERQEVILRPASKGKDKRDAYGAAFLRQNSDPKTGGSFTITGYGGWHVGQTVYITDSALGLSQEPFDITQVDVDVLMGSGTIRYDITYGQAIRSGVRRLRRQRNRR